MTIQQLLYPSDVDNYKFKAFLDGVPTRFSITFNTRDKHSYMDVFDNDNNPIRTGIKITGGASFLERTDQKGVIVLVDGGLYYGS